MCGKQFFYSSNFISYKDKVLIKFYQSESNFYYAEKIYKYMCYRKWVRTIICKDYKVGKVENCELEIF